jgi:MFS family permease
MNRLTAPISAAKLIAESAEQIEGIKTAAGLTDKQFEGLCIPVLQAYANHVQGLPLSAATFSAGRGAWDFGLIAAVVAYRYASTVIYFPEMGSEERRRLEPQCKYISFVASLATSLAMVTGSAKITSDGEEFHPLTSRESLAGWLAKRPNAAFGWRTGELPLSALACAAIAARFIPVGLLESFDQRVVLMLYDAVLIKTTMNGLESTMARVVRSAAQAVIEHYTTKQAAMFHAPSGAVQITKSDASAIADRVVAGTNPTIPVNPLAAPTAFAATVAPAAPPAAQPGPAAANQDHAAPAVPAATPGTASVPAAPVPAPQVPAAPAAAAPAAQGVTASLDDPLRGADRVLVEWFAALKLHPRYGSLREHLKVTEEGIEVPINMLGLFGTSGAAIRKMMEGAQLVIRRTDDARGLIVKQSLSAHFFSDASAAAASEPQQS